MKKVFTLTVASLFTMAVFAADHRPSVTVQASKNFEIVIDGKSYFGANAGMFNIGSLRGGYHSVTIYDSGRGFFRRKRMVSSTSFMLRDNDINLCIDQFGRVQVNESRMGRDRDDFRWDKKDKDDGYGKDYRYDQNMHQMKDHDRRF